jgi:small subunit ribosomal protein S6
MELKTYEAMFILDPIKASTEWDNLKKQIIAMIERRGGKISSMRKWGERKLTYEIKKHKRAMYFLVYFQAPPRNIAPLRRDLQLSELVMRILILAHSQKSAQEQHDKLVLETEAEKPVEKPVETASNPTSTNQPPTV